jgi:CelD/BcsL family acetyltransferase involved in cellulose biosynthesis
MLMLAAEDRVRAFMLFLDGEPVAYLYLPVKGRTLIYANLGYDSRFASLSPGTVLQFVALERLFAEKCFLYFDFTEGEGSHKLLFATDSVACASLVLLKPTLANHAVLAAYDGLRGAVHCGKAVVRLLGAEAGLRSLLRT